MTDDRLPSIDIGTYDTESEGCRERRNRSGPLGYRHVDTAEMYDNERAVGAAVEAAAVDREDVVVATKVHSRNLPDDAIDHSRAAPARSIPTQDSSAAATTPNRSSSGGPDPPWRSGNVPSRSNPYADRSASIESGV